VSDRHSPFLLTWAVPCCAVLCAPPRAGVLVLEELEHAKARGARIYAEYVGGAFTCDAHHMTEPQPQGRGVSSCLNKALESAGARTFDRITVGQFD
jgi:3-oxoacyl-(acyl-carrier-protein) synthase